MKIGDANQKHLLFFSKAKHRGNYCESWWTPKLRQGVTLPLDVPACTCSLSVTLYRNKLVIDSWGECYERKSWSGNDRMRDGCHQCLGLYLILANTLNLQHLMGQELKRSRLCFKIFAQKHQFCSFSKPFKKTSGEDGWRRRGWLEIPATEQHYCYLHWDRWDGAHLWN